MDKQTFTLYVAGNGELAARALSNFDRLVRPRLRERCTLNIVDVLKEPRVARQNRIMATPLLVRESPQPVVKILGDLSHEAKILTRLGLNGQAVETDASAARVIREE